MEGVSVQYKVIERCFVPFSAGTSDVVENNIEQEMTPVNNIKSLESEDQRKARQQEKEVAKPVKKRPKSEGYELFEKEGLVIGVVSVSHSLP